MPMRWSSYNYLKNDVSRSRVLMEEGRLTEALEVLEKVYDRINARDWGNNPEIEGILNAARKLSGEIRARMTQHTMKGPAAGDVYDMDQEFWEEAREKPAPCWGVGQEGEPCEQCRKRKKKGKIGCGQDCACGCSMSGATLGLHTKEEREGAYELAIKAYHHARTSQNGEARAWALGYLQAISDLANQEGQPQFALDVEAIARRLQ